MRAPQAGTAVPIPLVRARSHPLPPTFARLVQGNRRLLRDMPPGPVTSFGVRGCVEWRLGGEEGEGEGCG